LSKKGKGGRKGRGPGPVKGFRPGKVPPQVKRQQARARLGSDASWAQKRTVDAVAGRSPDEVRATLRRWTVGLLVGAVALALLGGFLYRWSVMAGVVVHVVTAALLVLVFRLRRQGHRLVEMAESLE
jgi:hypothetical protein